MTEASLAALARAFTEGFNDNDLDAVMSFFAEDGVYVEFDGTRSEGKEAVRAAMTPQFSGSFGAMRFEEEALFVEPAPDNGPDSGRVMISWVCSFDTKRGRAGWRGLDLLTFVGGKVTLKETYAKAEKLKLQAAA